MDRIASTRNSSSQLSPSLSRRIEDMSRVLIVDDDQGLVSLLQRFLQNEGLQTYAVFDHRSGLEAALTGEYDVVVLDVMLPGGSGFELLKSLRDSLAADEGIIVFQ